MMIGDPCSGNYFQFMSSFFPNSEHGDVTIDLFGCNSCERMDINDIQAWKEFDDDSFVVMETGVLGFSTDVKSVIGEIKRISAQTGCLSYPQRCTTASKRKRRAQHVYDEQWLRHQGSEPTGVSTRRATCPFRPALV